MLMTVNDSPEEHGCISERRVQGIRGWSYPNVGGYNTTEETGAGKAKQWRNSRATQLYTTRVAKLSLLIEL